MCILVLIAHFLLLFEQEPAFSSCIGPWNLGGQSWRQASKAVTGSGDIVEFSGVVIFSPGPLPLRPLQHSRIVLVEVDSLQEETI